MFLRFDWPNPSNVPVSRRLYSVRALSVYGKTVEAMQLDKYKRFFRSSRPREQYTVSVTAQCKVFIVVFLFYNATALMLIPLLTLFGLVACLFIFYFFLFWWLVLWLSGICLVFYPQMFDWGLFYDSALNGCDKVCVFEVRRATDITAGTRLKSPRVQIKQNATINMAEEQGELWWASLARSLGLYMAFGRSRNRGQQKCWVIFAMQRSGVALAPACVCVCWVILWKWKVLPHTGLEITASRL